MDTTKAKLLEKPEIEKYEKKKMFRLQPNYDTFGHYCEKDIYLSCIQLQPRVYDHPSPVVDRWILVDGRFRPVRNKLSALPHSVERLVIGIDGFSSSCDCESDESLCFQSNGYGFQCNDYNYLLGTHAYLLQTVSVIIID